MIVIPAPCPECRNWRSDAIALQKRIWELEKLLQQKEDKA